MRHTGVVDEDINRAEFFLKPRKRFGDLSADLDAAAQGHCDAAFTLDLSDDIRRVLSTRSQTSHPSARVSQFERNGFANAATGAGHISKLFVTAKPSVCEAACRRAKIFLVN